MSSVPNSLLKITTYISQKAKYARERDEITTRNGCELIVGVVARISGGPRQKEASLDDQVDHAKEVIAEYYAGQVVRDRNSFHRNFFSQSYPTLREQPSWLPFRHS